MKTGDKAKRLRIYISSTDKYEHTPLYEVIVYTALEHGITGATVLKGIMGYGSSHEIYSSKIWEFSEKTPLVVEIVDEPAKVDKFLQAISPFCEKSGKGLIITVDETTIAIHKIGAKR